MVLGFKKKKDPFLRDEHGFINGVDEDLLGPEQKKFLADVRKLTDRFSALELSKVEIGMREIFLEDLGFKIVEEKKQAKLEAERLRQQEHEIERKRSAAQVEAVKQQAELKSKQTPKLASQSTTKPRKAKTAPTPPVAPVPKQKPVDMKPEWFTAGKSVSHAQRLEQSKKNLKVVLDWLRLEPYSTVEVMALVLKCTVPGARKTLKKFVADGWLIEEEVVSLGSSRKKLRFGIASRGLFHLMDPGGVEPAPTADFKRKKYRSSNSSHVLNLQRSRAYMTRVENVKNTFRRWTPEKYLPYFNDGRQSIQHLKWRTYPDAVIENSHIDGLKIAIETEQEGKGTKRYKDLIWRHSMNIDAGDRYDRVLYVLPDKEEADSLKALFHRLVDYKMANNSEERQAIRNCFMFDTYDDLPKRIRALGKG